MRITISLSVYLLIVEAQSIYKRLYFYYFIIIYIDNGTIRALKELFNIYIITNI